MEQKIIVLGMGPAGLAAAIAARSRNKSVTVIGNAMHASPLARAERVDNYPGLTGLTGLELLEKLADHARQMGAELVTGKVNAILAWNGAFSLTVGSDVYQADALVLAPGVVRTAPFAGEEEYLGRGVSYCATCDGMLYRGRKVTVVGRADNAPEEANFLASIGCQVTYVADTRPEELADGIAFVAGKRLEVLGEQTVRALRVDGAEYPCDGVFILRRAVAPNHLLPSLEVTDGVITTDRAMATNIPGVFAAGDCTGQPWQVAKAVGEGLVAGEHAAEYLEQKNQ